MKLNKKIFAVSGLAALAVVGATWAYFNQSTSITNPLSTGTMQPPWLSGSPLRQIGSRA